MTPNPEYSDLVEKLRARKDLVELVRENVPGLRPAGKNLKACCPFHTEKTASFVVNPELQIFHCFGCARGGDVISFMMELGDHKTFKEAVALLARRAGLA